MEQCSNSLYKQAVLARPEHLQTLPENIISLVYNCTQGKLATTLTVELSNLLKELFEGTLTKEIVVTSECRYTPVILMLISRAAPDRRDNGSTVMFNIPNGVNAFTETQTAILHLLEFQASHSIYNIDKTNNKLVLFAQTYDSTGLALINTNTSTVTSIYLAIMVHLN
jgi:hypothetical protein